MSPFKVPPSKRAMFTESKTADFKIKVSRAIYIIWLEVASRERLKLSERQVNKQGGSNGGSQSKEDWGI